MNSLQILFGLIWLLSHSAVYAQWQSELVKRSGNGKLSYVADADGFTLPDFSFAGFKYGEEKLPIARVVLTLSSIEGDNTEHIQNALDSIAAMPADSNGMRGALLLKAGIYEVYGTIYVKQSGVVLRGEGQSDNSMESTIILAKGNTPHQRTVIQLGSTSSYSWNTEYGNRKLIQNDTVSIGSTKILLENTEDLSVGDNIIVYHPCTSTWLDSIDGGGTAADPKWQPGELPIIFYRYVRKINGDTIELDAPVYSPLVKSLAPSYVFKHSNSKMLRLTGIENLRVDIESAGGDDENHAWDAVRFNLVEDAWAQNVTTLGFGQAGFVTQYSYRVTLDTCSAIDPVAIITGSRMYNFNFYHGSQLILIKNSYARNGRHNYISNGTTSVSGCVVYNSISAASHSAVEGHRKWTVGLLFDNLKEQNLRSSGRLVFALYNRGDKGTAHGWSAAHSVAWNCNFGTGRACIQKPPISQNYAIGCFAKRINGHEVDFPQTVGYIEGLNQAGLQPASLFMAQLEQRVNLDSLPGIVYEPTSVIYEKAKDEDFLIYPNPSNGKFVLNGPSGNRVYDIAIINLKGQVVFRQKFKSSQNKLEINTKLHNGFYLLNLTTASASVTKRLVINHQ